MGLRGGEYERSERRREGQQRGEGEKQRGEGDKQRGEGERIYIDKDSLICTDSLTTQCFFTLKNIFIRK